MQIPISVRSLEVEAQRTLPWSSASSCLKLRKHNMARTLSQLICFNVLIFGLISIVISLDHPFGSTSEAFQSSDSRRRPMILPLYLSPPTSSSHHLRRPFDGRRLQKSDLPRFPNARMRLHDDLLTNGLFFLFSANFPQIIFCFNYLETL